LALDPDYADAHHNLAILLDKGGGRRGRLGEQKLFYLPAVQ
jgi:hypothetical protein